MKENPMARDVYIAKAQLPEVIQQLIALRNIQCSAGEASLVWSRVVALCDELGSKNLAWMLAFRIEEWLHDNGCSILELETLQEMCQALTYSGEIEPLT